MVEIGRPQLSIWRHIACRISKATRALPCTHTHTHARTHKHSTTSRVSAYTNTEIQGALNMTGQTVTCLHTISPGHISTTLYILENRHTIYDSFFKTDTQFMVHFPNHTHDLWQNFLCGKRSCTVNPINGQHHKYLSCKLTWRHYRHLKAP